MLIIQQSKLLIDPNKACTLRVFGWQLIGWILHCRLRISWQESWGSFYTQSCNRSFYSLGSRTLSPEGHPCGYLVEACKQLWGRLSCLLGPSWMWVLGLWDTCRKAIAYLTQLNGLIAYSYDCWIMISEIMIAVKFFVVSWWVIAYDSNLTYT